MDKGLIDDLRNAAAGGKLLVVSGAGISRALRRPDGSALPDWGELVKSLRERADKSKLVGREPLLDALLPAAALHKVHGDALIEASEILQSAFGPGKFEEAIADQCRERIGDFSPTHQAIAQLAPAGVITFNYDQGHESAFQVESMPFQPIRYDESEKLKARLAEEPGKPFVLKAHGCISYPPSLVLTSSSYHAILSKFRPYRLFLQHSLARFTVLVVGFALRDRDFDQLLGGLEIELGRPHQTHAFITLQPGKSDAGIVERAHLAAITARFGLQPLFVDDFLKVPGLLRSIGTEAGSLINGLVKDSISRDGKVRSRAHDQAGKLGKIGRAQMRTALLSRLDQPMADLEARSEMIYAFRGISEEDPRVPRRLVEELRHAGKEVSGADPKLRVECAAHALVVLRGLRIKGAELTSVLSALGEPSLLSQLEELDKVAACPRLKSYALAAAAEIQSRSQAI